MNLLTQIEACAKKGILIDYLAVDQIENGYKEAVAAGDMPPVTYTVNVRKDGEDIYQESFNDVTTALTRGLDFAEKQFDSLRDTTKEPEPTTPSNDLSKVECINNEFAEERLTSGKSYFVVDETKNYIIVVDDRQHTHAFDRARFKREKDSAKGVV